MLNNEKECISIAYTSEELKKIGSLLRSGDMADIARKLNCNYANVVDVLTGKRGKGITSRSKKGNAVVSEALTRLNLYASEIQREIAEKQNLLSEFAPLQQTSQPNKSLC
jgi:hypothetical protein